MLITLEKYLESRKQQADLRSKKLGLISFGIIIALAIAFPYALPLLGGLPTLVGVLSLATGASLLCCSIIPAFFGERLIDPQWYKEYADEQKELTQKITAPQETKSNNVSSTTIQEGKLKLNRSAVPHECIINKSANFDSSFFKAVKAENLLHDPELKTIVSRCITS